MAERCTSWFGHKFEPRYSTTPVRLTAKMVEEVFWLGSREREQLTAPESIYACDVCVRCGAVAFMPASGEADNG